MTLHWSIGSLNQVRLFVGVGFLGLAAVDFFFAFRRRPSVLAPLEAPPEPTAMETGASEDKNR